MNDSFRLSSDSRIDRSKPIHFKFDGQLFEGYFGDTLASALIANGVHLVGRSFKYHRPRGILTAGAEEPNALVGVGADEAHYTPNLRATQVEVCEGLVAESQNRWPSLSFDYGAINDAFARFLPAGFYYKTFMWPRTAWKRIYEPLIRKAAGLGRAPRAPDADRYTQIYAHCGVLVVGSGPAGLAAALAAGRSGVEVILCDEQAEMGGSLLAERAAKIDGETAIDWRDRALAELARLPNVRLLSRTTAFGWYPHNFLGLNERVSDHLAASHTKLPRERLWQVRAQEVVIATGEIERPLVFPNNDRPGIMLADAARTYANRYAAKPGNRAIVFTACDSAYRAALDLHHASVEIAAIADCRPNPKGYWIEEALKAGIDVRSSTVVADTAGRLRVKSATLATINEQGAEIRRENIPCDLVLMSGGFTPSVHLFSQSRGKLGYDYDKRAFLPDASFENERSAGSCRGIVSLSAVLSDGFNAGLEAAKRSGSKITVVQQQFVVQAQSTTSAIGIGRTPVSQPYTSRRSWIDFQNDVTSKDIGIAVREGFHSIEHVKRYTTTGMATDQGKTSNMNALDLVSKALNLPVPRVGLTTFRPPYTPITFGSFAGYARGELFDPIRKTPIHDWAEENGAVFEDVSLWKRAYYFPRSGEDMPAAVARECRATRSSVGIFDASTLGKIEVVGKDAAEFMNRMYTNAWTKLEPGRLRYGVMLREDGFVMDDGVVGRMSLDRFHVTTTTGGAARVLHMMEDYLQTEWPDLDVWLTSTTEQWAVIAVQGPRARDVLAPLVEDIDLSPEAMPHMSVREGKICGVQTRLFRVSFTGELGFEINVPAGFGRSVWESVMREGERFGITPYGTETMHVLRAEKGYIIVGQETDGTVTPDDAGLGWAIGKTKKDFVGKRSIARASMAGDHRKQLVGLLTKDHKTLLDEGAQVVVDPGASFPVPMIGHVTSSYWSEALRRPIALALIQGGRSRVGSDLSASTLTGFSPVQVVEPVFYDQKGERLNA